MTVTNEVIGKYTVIRKIGQGGFARTLLAENFEEKRVILKEFNPSPINNSKKAASLFQNESERLKQVGCHERIPTFVDYFENSGKQYIVQQFIDGPNLEQESAQQGHLSEKHILVLLDELLSIIDFIHSKKLIHRDIKPANIIRRFDDGKLCLVDFGAAKVATQTALAKTATLVGSFGFIAPEQLRGKGRFASDIYSLGATCIYLLTGILPTDLINPEDGSLSWQEHCEVTLELTEVLNKMVAMWLKDRYKSVAEVHDDLHSIVSDEPVSRRTSPRVLPTTYVKENVEQSIQPLKSHTSIVNSPNKRSDLIHEEFSFESVEVNGKGRIIYRKIHQASFFLERLDHNNRLEMIFILGDAFLMGSPAMERERVICEGPQHEVNVPSFYLSKYPVTQAQWESIMESNPSEFIGANRPVDSVTWNDAVEFCRTLSHRSGKKYRLPSESEWEYACRAGTLSPFYVGNTITYSLHEYSKTHPALANYYGGDAYIGQTSVVGTYPPNSFGLYDMHGNVYEWCQDTWHDNYMNAPKDGSAWINEDHEYSLQILRGGSWLNLEKYCRSASRDWNYRCVRNNDNGFRVALDA